MRHAGPIKVKVIYSAAGRRRRRSVRPAPGVRVRKYSVLGVVNLVAASALYCATWWWADPELRVRVLLHTPIPGVQLEPFDRADAARDDSPLLRSMWQSAPRERSAAGSSEQAAASTTGRETTEAALFVGTFVGWEALNTLAAMSLALSGGALVGRWGGARWRRAGWVIGVLVAVALAGSGLYISHLFGIRFKPDHLRIGLGMVTLLTAVAGMAVGRGVRWLTLLSAFVLIVAAGASAWGLHIGARFEAFRADQLPFALGTTMIVVFAAQSFWGWALLPIAWRMSR